jgi:tetratricopeptide (TPR) repeat protein/tRNA A-37 threonylcarbamoyl transferase component Bud32
VGSRVHTKSGLETRHRIFALGPNRPSDAAPGAALLAFVRGARPESPAVPARACLWKQRMNAGRWQQIQEVLDAALETDPTRWSGMLSERCSGDPELQREVEALLARLNTAEGFLDSLPAALAAALVAESQETAYGDHYAGCRIGSYQLVRQIGRGGMSRVYLADRADGQFEQQVAIKLLRPGLDSDIDLERSRRERQILARLNHPNIASLLDGGVTPGGIPYLVMEYVEGEAIDSYCARHQLGVRQRLALFLTILEATQYAHRNLVIHRDLKPSNIFVTADGRVKLLDFGLAKLVAPEPLTPIERITGTGQRWMTPAYAAPEQIRGDLATTLTDVYQLGAVLFEMLTGFLPFGKRSRSVHELERAILNDEPIAPSIAVGRAGATPPWDADRRSLSGDLDAIVLKALQKEPEHRYASVDVLADDVRRHLSSHPVRAHAPGAAYRARRYLRRHRIEVVAAAGIAITLIVGSAVSLAAARRAMAARDRAETASSESEAVTSFLLDLFEANDPGETRSDSITARDLLRHGIARAELLDRQPDVQARLFETTGRINQRLGSYAEGQALLERALALRRRVHGSWSPEVAATLIAVSEGLLKLGRLPAADSAAHEALAIQERILEPNDAAIAGTLAQVASVAIYRGNLAAAKAHLRRSLEVRQRALGDGDTLTAISHMGYGAMLRRTGHLADAEREFRKALATFERAHGEDHPQVAHALLQIAYLLSDDDKRAEEAEPLFRRALGIRRRLYGDGSPWVGNTLYDLSEFLSTRGDHAQAATLAREHLEIMRRAYGPEHSAVAFATSRLAGVLFHAGKLDEAEGLFKDAIDMERRVRGPDHGNVAGQEVELARLLIARGKLDSADSLLRDAIRINLLTGGPESPGIAVPRALRGVIFTRKGDYPAAELALRHAVRILERVTTRENPNLREIYGWLADLNEARSRPAEASRYRAIAMRLGRSE